MVDLYRKIVWVALWVTAVPLLAVLLPLCYALFFWLDFYFVSFFLFLFVTGGYGYLFYETFLGKPLALHHFFARAFAQMVLLKPMLLSQLRILEASRRGVLRLLPCDLRSGYQTDLDHLGFEDQHRFRGLIARNLETLSRYNIHLIQKRNFGIFVSYSLYKWYLSILEEGFQWMIYPFPLFSFTLYPINQMDGIHTFLLDFMLNIHQINCFKDAVNYVKRVIKFERILKEVLLDLKERKRRCLLPPNFVLRKVIAQIDRTMEGIVAEASSGPSEEKTIADCTKHVLYTHLQQQLTQFSAVSTTKKEMLLLHLEKAIAQSVLRSGYIPLRDYLQLILTENEEAETERKYNKHHNNGRHSPLLSLDGSRRDRNGAEDDKEAEKADEQKTQTETTTTKKTTNSKEKDKGEDGRFYGYGGNGVDADSEEVGIWRLPDGKNIYKYFLRLHTTTDMSPSEVHEIGLREMHRIQREIRSILQEEGLNAEDLALSMKQLREDSRYLQPETEEGKKAILQGYKEILTEAENKMGALFDLKPDVTVEVEPVPAFKEKGAPLAYYLPPPLDRSKGGTFYCNLKDVNKHVSWAMRTLAFHEGIPGHHYQLAVAQQLRRLPILQRNAPITAYAEGWALYAEQLAFEFGMLPTRLDRLGFFHFELLRAVRLVVDTGIHAFRWSREQAIEFMVHNTGIDEEEVTVEVERYIVLPGQACAYKIGQLKILELRERAKTTLGEDRFSLKEFHKVILSSGALPLPILEEVVMHWLDATSTKRKTTTEEKLKDE
ncbi:DUF885 domain-containing protein [Balamuthia mandrillaris]